MAYTTVASILAVLPVAWAADLTSHVDPLMGAENGGNNFPGVARPFGMVKLGPDLLAPETDAYSGYLSKGNFSGFSLMHEQGTGGAPKYGTVSQLPLIDAKDPLSNRSVGRSGEDEASVGYYKATTSEQITVELSASSHAGIYRYTFPKTHGKDVLVDVSHVLPSFRGQGLGQNYKGGNVTVFPDGHYEGHGIYDNGWNLSPDWSIYFCGYFDTAITSSKVYVGTDEDGSVEQPSGTASSTSTSKRVGAVFSFDGTEVISRVGISWISTEKACRNVQNEIPAKTDFQSVMDDAKTEWNSKVLSKITTTNTNDTSLQLLYSSLYFMHLIPTNQTGENPNWTSDEPYYQDIFTFWDLFRCSTALMQILQPTAYEEQIRSLIDIYRFDGYLPDGRSSNYNGRTQGGSNADNILADAYVKGVRGAVNWEDGYKAMLKDAEVTPPNNSDSMAPDSSTKEGRGALPDWLALGYITPKFSRAVTRAVEYSSNDFGLYQVAKGLGKTDDAKKYLNRSRNWRNHWNSEQASLGFNGFVVPRNSSGFVETDPLKDSGYWKDAYYEASSWAYSWAAVHDMKQMIEMMGGTENVLQRLDKMFEKGADGSDDGTIFDPTNEPMFNIPYLYHYISRPDLSVYRSRRTIKENYNTGKFGLPGNSDAGAMQTYLLWNMVGLYPITGQNIFLIHSPWFESLTIDLGGQKTLKVTASGGDPDGDGESVYVQRLKVNGEVWKRSWVTWEEVFKDGGSLEFELGERVVDWTDGTVPPSPAS